MKLTKETLKQIIKEELEATMEEGFFDFLKKKEKEPSRTSAYQGDQDAYNRGKISAEFGNERPTPEQIAKMTELSVSFTPEEKEANVKNFLKGFDANYDPDRTPRPPREEEPPEDPYADDEDAYRAAQPAVGALSMPKRTRRGSARGRGRY